MVLKELVECIRDCQKVIIYIKFHESDKFGICKEKGTVGWFDSLYQNNEVLEVYTLCNIPDTIGITVLEEINNGKE